MLPESALAHYTARRQIVQDTATLVTQLWSRVAFHDLDASWQPDLALVAVSAGQEASARLTEPYMSAVLAQTGQANDPVGMVRPSAFSGVASDGRNLDALLYTPIVTTKIATMTGASQTDAMARGLTRLLRITATQVQDAGRVADGVAIAARQVGGYVRILSLPSCKRCAVLAGRWYRWNAGFSRHPMCDCGAIPARENLSGDLLTDPKAAVESGQVMGLSEADTKAIVADGADVEQVINSTDGMYTAGGRKLTRAGTTKAGLAGQRLQGSARLRPEQIYRENSTREDVRRELRRNGYLI